MKDRRGWTAFAMTALMLLAGFAGPAAGAEWVYFATTAKGTPNLVFPVWDIDLPVKR